MTLDPKWIPMHWPCGVLPAARLAAKQKLTPELKETFAAWAEPKSLNLLQGSPVNCLVVPWAEGSTSDNDHQQGLEPLVRAGRERGISFVGTIAGKQGLASSVESGVKAGLAALMVESLEGLPKDAPVILRTPRSGVQWESVTSTFALTDNVWPRLGLDNAKDGDVASAGPTGVPWVNSNGWVSLLTRELCSGKRLWLEYDPTESSDLDHPASYALAAADACAYGSHWIISLDSHLRHGLTQNDPRAVKAWDSVRSTLKFFEANAAWSAYHPEGVLAVASDFRGDNEYLATEALNLLARRLLQFRILERSKIAALPLSGLKAILWLDSAEPDAAAKTKLRAFAEQGGLLIAPKLWWPLKTQPAPGGLLDHYRVYPLGRGSHAVPVEETSDPYELAVDVHLLLSRRNDLVRIFNVTACNTLVSHDEATGKRIVQILNYGSVGQMFLPSVWVRNGDRSAKFWSLDAAAPTVVQGIEAHGGREYQLPFISTYAALEFDPRGV